MYIPAGSLLDPTNTQGLAHLTEHCMFIINIFIYQNGSRFLSVLFSSSSKYPEMNCLDTFISYHGGTIHAYTELEFVSNIHYY